MADHLTRQEMRRDEVGEALERGVEYVATNWKRILIGCALLGLAIVLGAGWMQARARAAKAASYELAQAVADIGSAPEAAAGRLDEVIAGGGAAARIARLYRAGLPGADSQALWQQAAATEVDAVTVVARVNQLDALRRAQSWDQALQVLDGESGLPGDLLLYQTAVTLSQAGRTQEAETTVNRLLDEYPNSPWAAEGRRLQAAG